jgi:hypothetical protein
MSFNQNKKTSIQIDNQELRTELNAQLAENTKKTPWVAVNQFPIISPEANDTGRIQRAVDSITNGIVWFDGLYTLGNITLKSNISLMATANTILSFVSGSTGFNIDNLTNISFYDFEMDGIQQGAGNVYMIKGNNVTNLVIERCHFKNGKNGVFISNVVNGRIEKCTGHDFTEWAFYVNGCDGFKYIGNVGYNCFDGLKIAGNDAPNPITTIKNVEVANNYCYNNTRDGFDIASNNVENLSIHDNQFVGNTLNGIDCKIVYQGSYMRDVQIYGNQCLNNLNTQINIQTEITGVTTERVYVFNNNCLSPDITTTNGIRVQGLDKQCEIFDNKITKSLYGIRFVDSSKSEIHRNVIRDAARGVFGELQILSSVDANRIHSNDIISENECILISNTSITNTEIFRNKNKTKGTGYRINVIGSTGTIMYENEAGYSATAPTGRATQGEIWKNTNPIAGGYMGWVATTTSSSATFKGIGAIQT